MRLVHEREGDPPRARKSKGVAGKFVGTPDSAPENAQHHVDADDDGGEEQQRAADPGSKPRNREGCLMQCVTVFLWAERGDPQSLVRSRLN